MKTLVAALITALVVFTLATAWMEVVQPRIDLMARGSGTDAEELLQKPANKKLIRRKTPRAIESDDSSPDEPLHKVAKKSTRSTSDDEVSEATKERLLTQLEKVKQQEAKLVERQTAMELIYRDIYRELADVEEIRRRSTAELAMAEQRVLAAATSQSIAANTRSDVNQQPTLVAKSRITADVRIANVIQDLAGQGKIPAAASLLSGMKDRDVAKVLMSLSTRDPRLALQLSDQVQAAKQGAIRR